MRFVEYEPAMTSESHLVVHGDISIRLMRDHLDDYRRVVTWRNNPHVKEWWDPDDPPLTLEGAKAKYGPRIRGETPTTSCFIWLAHRPVGYIQFYPWSAYVDGAREMGWEPGADWFGVDVLIGEPDHISNGVGSRAVAALADFLMSEHGGSAVALTVDRQNSRAIRAYEKAGFRILREVLETDTRAGRRVPSWLMLRTGHVGADKTEVAG